MAFCSGRLSAKSGRTRWAQSMRPCSKKASIDGDNRCTSPPRPSGSATSSPVARSMPKGCPAPSQPMTKKLAFQPSADLSRRCFRCEAASCSIPSTHSLPTTLPPHAARNQRKSSGIGPNSFSKELRAFSVAGTYRISSDRGDQSFKMSARDVGCIMPKLP